MLTCHLFYVFTGARGLPVLKSVAKGINSQIKITIGENPATRLRAVHSLYNMISLY